MVPPLLALLALLFAAGARAAPYGASWNDVSEYLLGRVYVKVFFLESDERSPDTENWTGEEKAFCRAALEKALAEIKKRFVSEFEISKGSGDLPPGVNLDFTFDYETVPVSVEPIKLNGSGVAFSTGDVRLWANEVMASRGFAARTPPEGLRPLLPYPPYQYNVASYADHLRNTNGADWAVVVFFYDNSEDADGEFANGKSAGPPMGLGGPGLNFPDNRGKPFIEAMKTAGDPLSWRWMIHEFLHLWYALDEHPLNKHFQADAVGGYLAGPNLNYLMAKGIECSMYSANLYWPLLCEYSLRQIGWADGDGDHIPDILDVDPTVEAHAAGTSPPALRGRAVSPPLANRNPYSEGGTVKPPYDLSVALHLAAVPEKRLGIKDLFRKVPAFTPPFPWTRNDITINRILNVEYRLLLDGKPVTGWKAAAPADGAFDAAVEEFGIILEPAPGAPEKTAVEVRAVNSVSLHSPVLSVPFPR